MSAPNPSAPVVSGPTKPAPVVSAPVVSAPNTPAPLVPTQIVSAPSMAGRWQNGLCSNVCGGDFATCCAAWCCPSFLYGRAAQRLDFYPHTNPAEIQTFDKHCCMFACAGCMYMDWLPMAFKREEMRARFGIEGDMCQDILVSMFCTQCGLAQMNSEMKDRAAQELLAKGIGYQSQTTGMVYQPPNQQPQLQLQPPVQQQPQVQEKKSTPQGI